MTANKYPGEYFFHFIAMFYVNNNKITKASIQNHIAMYKAIEGEKEFQGLVKEVRKIQKNDDLKMFVTKRGRKSTETSLKELNEICSLILKK